MLRMIQWGTGFAGQRTAKAIHKAPDLELVGCYTTSDFKHGRDVGDICGTEPMGVTATMDKEAIFAMPADCVLYMTMEEAGLERPVEEICRLLASGKNVVSTAATGLFYPKAMGADIEARIQAACQQGGTSFHGCGIEPGWAGTTFPLIMSGAVGRIDHILIQEILDYGPYPTTVMMFDLMGYGGPINNVPPTPIPFEAASAFRAPLLMIADAMGVEIEQVIYEAQGVAAERDYDIPAGRIAKGTLAGKRFSFTAIINGKPRITIEHVNRASHPTPADWPQGAGWYATITGAPSMKLSAELTLDGGDSTGEGTLAAAMHVIHSIRPVCAAPAGIRTFFDLPPIIGRGVMTDEGVNG